MMPAGVVGKTLPRVICRAKSNSIMDRSWRMRAFSPCVPEVRLGAYSPRYHWPSRSGSLTNASRSARLSRRSVRKRSKFSIIPALVSVGSWPSSNRDGSR
jgi:hypothetical protein